MVSHNNVIPNVHLKKKWQFRVKTWFNQPARKHRRRQARAKKAKAIYPRPAAGLLRPVVRCCSLRYNMKTRYGRGFSLDELKAAGISKKLAPTIGIAVDHRRRNLSEEGLQANVERLKAYKSALVLYPRNSKKVQEGETKPADAMAVEQVQLQGPVLPLTGAKPALQFTDITPEMKSFSAYGTLRLAEMNKRMKGKREKRQREKEAEEKEKMK